LKNSCNYTTVRLFHKLLKLIGINTIEHSLIFYGIICASISARTTFQKGGFLTDAVGKTLFFRRKKNDTKQGRNIGYEKAKDFRKSRGFHPG
jgi:hypothetical protein